MWNTSIKMILNYRQERVWEWEIYIYIQYYHYGICIVYVAYAHVVEYWVLSVRLPVSHKYAVGVLYYHSMFMVHAVYASSTEH